MSVLITFTAHWKILSTSVITFLFVKRSNRATINLTKPIPSKQHGSSNGYWKIWKDLFHPISIYICYSWVLSVSICISCMVNYKYHIFKQFTSVNELLSRVFASGPVGPASVPSQVIPKTQKMVFDAALLNTQHYKVKIKGKMEQSREWSCALLDTAVL